MTRFRISVFHLGLGLLAGTLLAYELLLLRLFKIAQGSEFTSVAISIALLGFGASGTLLALTRRWTRRHARWVTSICAPLAGAAMLGAYFAGQSVSFRPEFLVWGGRYVWGLLLWTLPLVVPFLIGATALGVVFLRWPRQTRGLYAANLIGSGIGAAGLYVLLFWMRPESGILLLASLTALAGAMMARGWSGRWTLACLVLLVGGVFALSQFGMPEIHISDTRDLALLRQLPDARTVATYHSPDGRIDLIASDAFHHLPGLSLNAPPADVRLTAVCLDGDLVGDLIMGLPIPSTQAEAVALFRGVCDAPWARLVPGRWCYPPSTNQILWLGPPSELEIGRLVGFEDLFYAFPFDLVIAQDNPLLWEVLSQGRNPSPMGHSAAEEPYWSTVPATRRTSLRTSYRFWWNDRESLTALRSEQRSMDLIAEVSWRASPLQESSLRTGSGLREARERLSSRGMIILSAPIDQPPRSSLRLVSLMASVSEGACAAGSDSPLIALRGFSQIAGALYAGAAGKLSAYGNLAEFLMRIREASHDLAFDLVWTPDISPDEVNQYNILDESIYYDTARRIFAGEAEEVYREYPFELRPPTEWWPFFWQPFKPATLWGMLVGLRPEGLEQIPEANAILALIYKLRALAVAAAILILLPLVWVGRGRDVSTNPSPHPISKRTTFLYFACLGAGYLMVEILMIFLVQRVLGKPVLAASVTLAAFLVFSGLGSLLAGHPRWIFLPLIVLALVAVGAFEFLALQGMTQPLGLRILMTLLVLLPLNLLMGMPFPRGLIALSAQGPALVPWAWGVNGFASVLAAPLATLFALTWGYEAVLFTGLGCYALAGIVSPRFFR